MMMYTVLVQALCAIALLRYRPAVAQEQNIYNVGFTSYSLNRNCSSTVELPEGAVSMLDYSCDSLNMPSSWNLAREDEVYDLVIVGGGASGVYMANRLVEEFKKQGQPPPVIALAERSNDVGGRLMSARGSGGLGLAVDQLDAESKNIPPEEYGGMRIDPYRYRLVWDKIIEFGKAIYGEDQCLSFEDCMEESVNCCTSFCGGSLVVGGGWWVVVTAAPSAAAGWWFHLRPGSVRGVTLSPFIPCRRSLRRFARCSLAR